MLSSCATPSTPETRKEGNPQIFQKLSESEKQTVSQGKLKKGMSKEAVFIAWGKADREIDTFKNNKRLTRWDYTTLVPVYSNSFYGGIGIGHYGSSYGRYGSRSRYYGGHGGYGRYGRGHYNSFGIGTSVRYSPKNLAQVIFENEKVTEWSVER